jgi:hypothetical protein
MNLKECRLLVTPTSYGKNDPRLKTELEAQVGEVVYNQTGKPLTSAEVANLLPGMDGYIAGLDGIDANALIMADRLKVIARYGVGVDNVDLSVAREKGIVVTNTPGANSASVAASKERPSGSWDWGRSANSLYVALPGLIAKLQRSIHLQTRFLQRTTMLSLLPWMKCPKSRISSVCICRYYQRPVGL